VQGTFRVGYYGVPTSSSPRPLRLRVASAALGVALIGAIPLRPTPLAAQSRPVTTEAPETPAAYVRPAHYWRSVAAGFAASLLAHEGAHVITAVAVGGRPTFGLSKGRPTVFSGLDADLQPREQFLFSSMGLNVQALLDEAILDVPHARGGAFERGVLAGGIATALFYVTLGRTASVSDVDYMARTSSLSKTDITLIYGGVAVMHLVRVRRDSRYAHFFVRPMPAGERGLRVGVDVR
jgi:hypothetical protein